MTTTDSLLARRYQAALAAGRIEDPATLRAALEALLAVVAAELAAVDPPATATAADTADAADGAPPLIYSEQLAVQWPADDDPDHTGPRIEAPDPTLRDDLAEARAREVADLYALHGARLVRLVTTVHPIP